MKNPGGKSKPIRFSRLFAIDLVVPLPLEACIHQLEHYAANARLRITIQRSPNRDHAAFQVVGSSPSPHVLFANGTLEAVGPASTRIRARINRAQQADPKTAGAGQSGLWVLASILFFLAIGVMPILNPDTGIPLALMVFAIVFIGLPILWYALSLAEGYFQRRFFLRRLRGVLSDQS